MFTKQQAERADDLFPDSEFTTDCKELVTPTKAAKFIRQRERQNLFLIYYALGITIKEAATAALVSEDLVYIWKNDKNSSFSIRVDLAKEYAKHSMIEAVLAAAKKDWKAAAWYLERRHAKEWGEVKKAEVTHNIIGTISVVERKSVAERFLGLLPDESPTIQDTIN